MTLSERFQSPGPKRILALDGGGIRGALTVGFLQELEALLRKRYNNPKLLLCDYFDLIGGTSTGSIIATLLAIGKDTKFIKEMYLELGGKIFAQKSKFLGILTAKFKESELKKQLEANLGNRTVGDPTLRTGLCIVTKRADTGGTWPIINHPGGKYFKYNKDILLRDAVRASAAAPTYFKPESIDVGGGQIGAFVDGGVSMANNPALTLFLIATLQGFPFHWSPGADNLLVLSVGTGSSRSQFKTEDVLNNKLWNWASAVPNMLMYDANMQNQLLLQAISRCPNPVTIDREVSTAAGDLTANGALLHYVRYDASLNEDTLNGLKMGHLIPNLDDLREMSNAENRFVLAEIGEKAASLQVKGEHFPAAFDLKAS